MTIPTLLFGNDSFKSCLATLSYTGIKSKPTPEFLVHIPRRVIVPVYQASPSEIFTCKAEYTLEPYETKSVDFYLHCAAPVIRTEEILITSIEIDLIHILPSKSDLEFVPEKNCYMATGCIVNLTNNVQKGKIKGKYEIMGPYDLYPIQEDNKDRLRKIMWKHPPVREIYPGKVQNQYSIPIPTIHATSAVIERFNKIQKGNKRVSHEIIGSKELEQEKNHETKVSNEEIDTEVLGGSKVSYTGEADISSKIIDPGLEIPTLIHKSAEEALNLSLFDIELRPYLQDIFLDKYPNVVSLHSLDAGDVSKTLGFTSLRLIPIINLMP
jgi:hypothetical protein